jgi:hypothetical protein
MFRSLDMGPRSDLVRWHLRPFAFNSLCTVILGWGRSLDIRDRLEGIAAVSSVVHLIGHCEERFYMMEVLGVIGQTLEWKTKGCMSTSFICLQLTQMLRQRFRRWVPVRVATTASCSRKESTGGSRQGDVGAGSVHSDLTAEADRHLDPGLHSATPATNFAK